MRKGSVRAALLLGSALVAFGFQSPAVLGQPVAQAQGAAQAAQQQFDIPAQSLTTALDLFARHSGWQVGYPAALAQGKSSAALRGSFTPAEALGRLLSGTGLIYRATGANSVTLVEAPQGGNAAVLPPVTVQGQAPETPWSHVDGYVARRSATGTKSDASILETPQAITTITRDQMEARGVQRDSAALYYAPGVYSEPYGSETRYDSFFLRGFDLGRSQYRDGLRMVGGTWASLRTETYGLERIDLARGPVSVLYGQTNPGGMLNKITKRPTETAVHSIEGVTGSYDQLQGGMDFGGPLDEGKKVLYRFTAMAREADTQYEYGNSGRYVPDDRQYVAPALTLRPSESTTLTILTDYLYTETAAPFTYALRTTPPQATHVLQGDPNFNTYEYNQYTAGYLFEHRFDNDWAVRQNLRYAAQDILYRNLGVGTLAGSTLPRSASIITEDLRGFTVDNQVEANFGTGPLSHTVVAGLDHQRTNWRTFTRSSAAGSVPALNIANPVYGVNIVHPTAVSGNAVQEADQTGVYAQDQIKYDHWILTLGGRHDWAKTVTDNRFTPSQSAQMSDQANTFRTALSYQFDMGLAPYVSYSESFQPQSGVSFAGNPFVPTTGEQYEFGVKYQPKGFNSFIAGTVYELTQQNVLTQDLVNGGSYRVQTGEVRSRGLELEGVASLAQGLNLIASYTYTDAEVTAANDTSRGKRPTLVPEHMASLWADYTVQHGEFAGVGFGGGARYIGPTYFNADNTWENKAYTLVDALVRYDLGKLSPAMAGTTVSLNVSNLFDKEYATCYSTSGCTWGVGRTVLAKVKYDW